jgi:hypothetical protein
MGSGGDTALRRICGLVLATALGFGCSACSHLPELPLPGSRGRGTGGYADDTALYRAAQRDRYGYLEREVVRLKADLEQAEQQLVAIESGLRGTHTRADAVSSIGDARIAVERAGRRAPWRAADAEEARAKVAEAERQLEAGHTGSAVFFASRALRIAANLDAEASQVERHATTRFVRGSHVNLRSGPSTRHLVVDVLSESMPVFPERSDGQWVLVRTVNGPVGWIHTSLLRPR